VLEKAITRSEYLQAVCSALAEYVRRGGELRIASSRQGDELSIHFVLDGADEYHEVLAALSQERLN
jgi:hypothetical protein